MFMNLGRVLGLESGDLGLSPGSAMKLLHGLRQMVGPLWGSAWNQGVGLNDLSGSNT